MPRFFYTHIQRFSFEFKTMNNMLTTTHITGLIFAGGRGSRMGNVDKGLQLLHGEALISHVIKRLAPQVDTLMINANRNLETYRQFSVPVLIDELEGFAGPLAGLQTGLRHCTTPYLLTVPCDTPFFPENLAAHMYEALVVQDADIAVAATTIAGRHQTQPVFALLKTSLLPHLNAFLASGNRKIQMWHDSLNKVDVLFEKESDFSNINTLEELQQASNQV